MLKTNADKKLANLKISVICPFYNEADIIQAALERMINSLNSQLADWELIVVNDGSTDESLMLANEVIKNHKKNVRLLSASFNEGRGRALKNGINAATGDIIVTTEVDCSWGQSVVKDLATALITRNSHVVVASPHLFGGGLVNVPWHRRALSYFGNRVICLFFRSGVSMNTGMTRGYLRDVIQPLQTYENGKEFHLEVLLKLTVLQFRISEIPATITWLEDKLSKSNGKSSRKSSTKLFRTILSHLVFIGIAEPLFSFGILFVLFLTAGIIFIGVASILLLIGKPSAFFAIIGLLLVLFALIFCGFSVLFFQLRESLRESWCKHYKPHQLPNRQMLKI